MTVTPEAILKRRGKEVVNWGELERQIDDMLIETWRGPGYSVSIHPRLRRALTDEELEKLRAMYAGTRERGGWTITRGTLSDTDDSPPLHYIVFRACYYSEGGRG